MLSPPLSLSLSHVRGGEEDPLVLPGPLPQLDPDLPGQLHHLRLRDAHHLEARLDLKEGGERQESWNEEIVAFLATRRNFET